MKKKNVLRCGFLSVCTFLCLLLAGCCKTGDKVGELVVQNVTKQNSITVNASKSEIIDVSEGDSLFFVYHPDEDYKELNLDASLHLYDLTFIDLKNYFGGCRVPLLNKDEIYEATLKIEYTYDEQTSSSSSSTGIVSTLSVTYSRSYTEIGKISFKIRVTE